MTGGAAVSSGCPMPSGRRPEPVRLEALAARIGATRVVGPAAGVAVRRVVLDHREVRPPGRDGGDLYFCLVGERADGHDFAPAAAAAGAVALAVERVVDLSGGPFAAPGREVPELVLETGDLRRAMAEAACAVSGDPAEDLLVVGVTGTNGKTTTTHLLRAIFEHNGWSSVLVGTLGGERTTPEAPVLQSILARAREQGSRAAVVEVTSHGIVQHRVDGYVHDVAVFTNLSQDHLDYHGTMEAYFEAKAALFTAGHSRRGVVNADDAYGRRLLSSGRDIPLSGYGLADVSERVDLPHESRFVLHGHRVRVRLAGELNVRNAVAAAAAARAAGVDDATIAEGLSEAPQVPGRFETVPNALSLLVVVDYAHTPAGLAEALRVMRSAAPASRLIVVFGA
ncbi:MAG: Mur ligase family protein, partial [Acidimicrobiales bacterium]